MNEETIRQIVREEIETALNESADSHLVDYDSFKREIVRSLKQVKASPDIIEAAEMDAAHIVERTYDELKAELAQLTATDAEKEMVWAIGFTCLDLVTELGGDEATANRIAQLMTNFEFDNSIDASLL
jgi:predicted transcriptional regulator